jgi:DNA-binding response OmpR family regulator
MTKRIAVLVLDSAVLRAQLRQWLLGWGYDVIAASAVTELATLGEAPTVVIAELITAHSNGFKVLRHCAAHYQCLQLLLSGSGRSTDRYWGLNAGATDVLVRPCTQEQLAKALGLAL